MVLYVAEHIGGLSQLLTLKLVKHIDKEAVLLVANEKSENFLASIRNTAIFNKIITYKKTGFYGETAQDVKDQLFSSYDPLLREHGVDIKKIEKCYVVYVTNSCFTIYLNLHGIEYTTIETKPNISYKKLIQKPSITFKRKKCSIAYRDLEIAAKPIINITPVKNIIVFPQTRLEKANEYVEVFDFNDEFDNLPLEFKEKIAACFEFDKEFIQPISLLLPNSATYQNNIKIARGVGASFHDLLYTPKKYELVYAILAEYFHDKKFPLVFKSHPNSTKSCKTLDSISAIKISSYIPIEFLQYVPGFKIGQTLSLATTAANKLRNNTETEVSLGTEFLAVFHCMDMLWATMKIINTYFKQSILYYGPAFESIKTMYRYNFDDHNKREIIEIKKLTFSKHVTIINTTLSHHEAITQKPYLLSLLKKAKRNCIIFFINSLHDYCFADLEQKDLLEHIVPVILTANPVRDNHLGDIGEKAMYAFCKNKSIRETIKSAEFSRTLNILGTEIKVAPLSETRFSDEIKKCYQFAVNNAVLQNVYLSRFKKNKPATIKEDPIIQAYSEVSMDVPKDDNTQIKSMGELQNKVKKKFSFKRIIKRILFFIKK